MLGVLLMALEELQARFEKCLQFGIFGRGNQQRRKRPVDLVVVRDLVVDVCLVESRAIEGSQFGAFISCSLSKRLAGVIVSGATLSFLTRSSA